MRASFSTSTSQGRTPPHFLIGMRPAMGRICDNWAFHRHWQSCTLTSRQPAATYVAEGHGGGSGGRWSPSITCSLIRAVLSGSLGSPVSATHARPLPCIPAARPSGLRSKSRLRGGPSIYAAPTVAGNKFGFHGAGGSSDSGMSAAWQLRSALDREISRQANEEAPTPREFRAPNS